MSIAAAQASSQHVSPAGAAGFNRRSPPLTRSPAIKPSSSNNIPTSCSSATVSTKTTLSNLDNFLSKRNHHTDIQHHDHLRASRVDHDDFIIQEPESKSGNGSIGLFSALNLQRLLPNPTEEMSPKGLGLLQRLLSDTPRLSPKNSIASRWRLYHGAVNWEGLLDPLDENLRRELVRYGDLVGAAYHAFDSLPGVQPGQPRHVILPDRSYRVTASLYATASLDIPNFISAAPAWMKQRTSWIGYVAVCNNEREIQRMGRRDIVIALRGTATCLEWAENFRAGLVPMSKPTSIPSSTDMDHTAPKVACGFWNLFKTSTPRVPSLAESVVTEIKRLMEKYKGEEISISITGHSLGAALGLLVADELAGKFAGDDIRPSVAVFSFGGPKVGNGAFAKRVEKRGVKALRVVNAHDLVPRVPAGLSNDCYSHVGQELKVNSKSSPFLKPDASPGCCHDLEAYLHLIDGFLGSGCPFRANAKRGIARLMDQQRASVKRLYVTKANTFAVRENVDSAQSVLAHNHAGALLSPSS